MRAAAAALALVATLATGCGGDPGGEGGGADATLRVFAASSLTAPFEELAEDYEAEHAGVEVELTFGGSSDLAAQIDQGAPADVFASADLTTMQGLTEARQVRSPQVFATNTLTIAVPPDNPAGIEDLDDLADPAVRLVVCAPAVPCGAATQQLAAAAGVELRPVSEEQAVTDVLGKVRAGEADAGLVYVTDVLAAGDDVQGIDVPEAAAVVNAYPIAPVAGSPEADLADDFVALVVGQSGQAVLVDHGFGKP